MKIFRALLLANSVVAAVGCANSDGPVGNIDYVITGPVSLEGGATLHIDPSGAMTRMLPSGAQAAMLDPNQLADLHGDLEAARFPDLAPLYACPSTCPDIASSVRSVTVQLGGHSYTVAADSYFMSQPGNVPAGLVTAIDALQQLLDHSDWR